MQTIQRQLNAVRKSAENMDAAALAAITTASPGDVVRQGDLYLVCLESRISGQTLKERQLAPGSTQGSRHIADGECDIVNADKVVVAEQVNRLVKGADVPQQLIGPVVECLGETTITHPEHGHRTLPADSIWAVVYQRAYADEIRRVQD